MNEKVKRLIIDNVFDGVDVDFDLEIENEYFDENSNVLKIIIYVDSYKLYKSSGYFNKKYYNLISYLADGNLDEEIFEFLPMVGYDFEYLEVFYDKSDLDGYKNLFYEINDLGYKYKVQDRYYSTPWLYIVFNLTGPEVDNLYNLLEKEVSIEDVVLLAK